MIGTPPQPPALNTAAGSVHLADVDGDGVPDLIVCQNHSEAASTDPVSATWMVHLWQPAQGSAPAGFNMAGALIDELSHDNGFNCDTDLFTVDVNGDGKVDLVVQQRQVVGGTQVTLLPNYLALTRLQNGSWDSLPIALRAPLGGGRVMFLDVNGDGLPDAVESDGETHTLLTYMNMGATFTDEPVSSLPLPDTLPDQDTFFALAVPIDYNGDGRQDILMPVPGGTLPDQPIGLPAWAILKATGTSTWPTFAYVDTHIPFDAVLTASGVTLADPYGARVGDVNGDGAEDVVLLLSGVFNIFQNLAADQDLLVAVSDGMNAHDPTDLGFTPNVSFAYGHLTDASITNDTAAGDPALESDLYLSHADTTNGCVYPISCAVGPRRVVSGYTANNGADGVRHFAVRYRDGRYHRLGRGFLGFEERIVTDLDTLAGTADVYGG